MADTSSTQSQGVPPRDDRRWFLAAATTVVTGALVVLTPLAVGVVSFLSPLFRKQKSPKVRVALLSQTPDDGLPRYFPVSVDREDAWNRYPDQQVGGVYLVRQPGTEQPLAFTAKCPHAGCFIGYTMGEDHFQCPCHTSAFRLDGSRLHGDAEVAPRGMDQLPVELRPFRDGNGESATEVWVEFIDFLTGRREQIPSA
jgi:quinol---cytochrome c reductase iron-sulfur subunit, bacillus type